MIEISVVIPTYNRVRDLLKCLKSLYYQDYPRNRYEIVVVDDGSTDGTGKAVKRLSKEYPGRLVYLRQENSGPATARNNGVRNSQGRYVLFTGDDCIADKCLLKEHMRFHERFGEHSVLGFTALHKSIKRTPFIEFIYSGPQFGYNRIEHGNTAGGGFYYTTNISTERKVLLDNPFHEGFKYASYEDIELGYRLQEKGIKTIYNKNAITYHNHPTDLGSFSRRQRITGRSAVIFYDRYGINCRSINFLIKLKIRMMVSMGYIILYKLLSPLGMDNRKMFPFYREILNLNVSLGILEHVERGVY